MKAHLNIIEEQRKKVGISISELARRVNRERAAVAYFLQRGRQLNSDLELITKLCKELGIKNSDVVK